MTIYSIPLSQSERASIIHMKGARIHWNSYLRTREDRFLTFVWLNLLYAVSGEQVK